MDFDACESWVVYQGVCALDHTALSADAGGDWDGDGNPDVVLGGGAKVDLEEQNVRPDDFPNPTTIYLRRLGTQPIVNTCPEGADAGVRYTQFPSVRLYGTQVSPDPNDNDWMLADRFGWCVRFIGDLDGQLVEYTEPGSQTPVFNPTDELAVGAPWFDVQAPGSGGQPVTHHNAGAVFLYLGGQFTPHTPAQTTESSYASWQADDKTTGPCSLIITGEAPGDYFGYSIARETDFDGDGIPDLVVGAPRYAWQEGIDPSLTTTDERWPNSDVRSGSVYVIRGSAILAHLGSLAPGDPLEVSVSSFLPDGAIRIDSATSAPRDRFGASVDSFGNHHSDGGKQGDELVIGAPSFRSDWHEAPDGDIEDSSASYHKTTGTAADDIDSGPGFVEVWSFDSAQGTHGAAWLVSVIDGPSGTQAPDEERATRYGWAVSRISTSSGQPYGFCVGGPGYDLMTDGAESVELVDAGIVEGFSWASATAATPAPAWQLTGGSTGERFGWSLSSGGDFDADGEADVAIGARGYSPSPRLPGCSCGGRLAQAGRVYIVRGETSCGPVDRRLLARVDGEEFRDRLGFSVATLGSVDDLAGDEFIGGALAWPADADLGPFSGAPCPGGAPTGDPERGRAYLISLQSISTQ